MPKVTVLPDYIASQIAAGEVVEKPASVVKELVENSIDAGARQIEISIANNCLDIRVADDGHGMDPEDAVLSFSRHATSKIASADDLSRLATLGFRGEALPSISSISRFTCTTRTSGASAGTRVETADGRISAFETGCAVGTVMDVKDLFYNVPARLKFMKRPATEFAYIQDIVQSLAVANPEISFELRKNDNTTFKTSGSGLLDQAARESRLISGKESLIEFETAHQEHSMRARGFLARPTSFRGDRKAILTIVNKRPVRCALALRALDQCYSDLIPKGRYPIALVMLELDSDQIDVNIHPTKKEIKYANSNNVYMFLHGVISKTLLAPRKELISVALASSRQMDEMPVRSSTNLYALENPPRPSSEHISKSIYSEGSSASSSEPRNIVGEISTIRDYAKSSDITEKACPEEREISSNPSQLSFRESLSFVPGALADYSPDAEEKAELPAGWRLAGYVHNTYFLFETNDGIELIEQHIAHERLLYEQILKDQSVPGRITPSSQRLILSVPLVLSASQEETLFSAKESLENLGFAFEKDADGIHCSQVPIQLAHHDYATIIQKMLEDIGESEEAHLELEATKSLACQAAIKNGMPLSEKAILELVAAWLRTPRNDTCPHGRPVRLKYSRNKLFQLFHPA